MNRLLGLLAAILIFIILLLWGIPWAANGGWPASGATDQRLPEHIQSVTPADGQILAESYGFCAHFFYDAGRGMGDEPQGTLRYYLNGVNVTRSVTDLARLEYGYPAPVGEPCYRQTEPLRPGWHTAKIRYADRAGERFTYTWRFAVLPPPEER